MTTVAKPTTSKTHQFLGPSQGMTGPATPMSVATTLNADSSTPGPSSSSSPAVSPWSEASSRAFPPIETRKSSHTPPHCSHLPSQTSTRRLGRQKANADVRWWLKLFATIPDDQVIHPPSRAVYMLRTLLSAPPTLLYLVCMIILLQSPLITGPKASDSYRDLYIGEVFLLFAGMVLSAHQTFVTGLAAWHLGGWRRE